MGSPSAVISSQDLPVAVLIGGPPELPVTQAVLPFGVTAIAM